MRGRLPTNSRVYQNHHLDSTRWDAFKPRESDIIVATSYKAGTTWTQAIVANLLFSDQQFPAPPWQMSPWLDIRTRSLKEVIDGLEAQTHRRFIKTHLALDGLPFYPEAKYIFVSRDGRDVFMSLWNHYRNYNEEAFKQFNETPSRVGPEFPPPPEDIHTFWRNWCTRGWFEWEKDGYPFWSHLRVTQSWWNYQRLPNLLILHFADMKKDLASCVSRVAEFLDIEVQPAKLNQVVNAVSFGKMKEQGDYYVPRQGAFWKGGKSTFLFKGTNGRWQGVLSEEELELYDEACAQTLSSDCREWLENGGHF